MANPTYTAEDLPLTQDSARQLEADRAAVDHARAAAHQARTWEGKLATGRDAEPILALYETTGPLPAKRRAALIWHRKRWGLRAIVLRNHAHRWDLQPHRWRLDAEDAPEPEPLGQPVLSPLLQSIRDGDPRPVIGWTHWSLQDALRKALPWQRWLRWQLDRVLPQKLGQAWAWENARRNRDERAHPVAKERLRLGAFPNQTVASKCSLVVDADGGLGIEWTSVNDKLPEALWARTMSGTPQPRPRLSKDARKLMRLLQSDDHLEQGLVLAQSLPQRALELLRAGEVLSLPGLGGQVDNGLSSTANALLAAAVGWDGLPHVQAQVDDLARLGPVRGAHVTMRRLACSTPSPMEWLDAEVRDGDAGFVASLPRLKWLRLEVAGDELVLDLPHVEWLRLGARNAHRLVLNAPRLRSLVLVGYHLKELEFNTPALERFRAPHSRLEGPLPDAPEGTWCRRLGWHDA